MLAAAIVASSTLFTRVAPADEPPPAAHERWFPQNDDGERRGWYGWQTIIGLGLSDAMLVGAAATKGHPQTGLLIAGIGGHVLANPIVHLANRHPARAGWSFLFLLAGAGAGAGAGAKGCTTDCGTTVIAGTVAGALLANVIEVSFLSNGKRREGETASSIRLAPLAGPNRAGLSVGVTF
jgi:hypothetical protein